ncbi:MAG: hypothetical protein HRU70_00855 [Phycisphaeraceae bacterium]|nr:MAG: hypothetical protein HRU70_00855 [Phycisphaeraceae bacterium]
MIFGAPSAALCSAFLLASATAFAHAHDISVIARTGQAVAADEPGLTFAGSVGNTPWSHAVMNTSGDVAFTARVTLPNATTVPALFRRDRHGARMLARVGSAPAYLGGSSITQVFQPQMADDGSVWVRLVASNQTGYLVKYLPDGSVSASATTWSTSFGFQLHPRSDEAVYWHPNGTGHVIGADPGSMGPLFPSPPVFEGFPAQATQIGLASPHHLNASRGLASLASYTAGIAGFAVAAGTPERVWALIETTTNGPLPPEAGAAPRVNTLWAPWLNDHNRFVYRVDLTSSPWRSVIFFGDGPGASVLIHHGQAAPGFQTGATVSLPNDLGGTPILLPRVNNRGAFLIAGRVNGVQGVTGMVYWSGREGGLRPVLIAGVTEAVNAPGVRPSLQFAEADQASPGLAFNDLGQIAFTDARTANPVGAVFGYDPVRGLVVFARPQTDLTLEPGVVKRVARANLIGPHAGYRNLASGLSGRGRLCFALDFTDGTGAVVEAVLRCDADMNGDGFIDFFDLGDYVDAFDAGSPGADFDGDGFIDFFDADRYLEAYERGC